MFPITTNLRFQRLPWVTLTLIVLNILFYVGETALQISGSLQSLTNHYNLVPAKFVLAFTSGSPDLILKGAVSLVLSMFRHGSFLHIFLNMAALLAFGPALEAALGTWRYILFYFGAGAVAALIYVFSNTEGVNHVVGASGAIAGVQGAFLFLWPRARVTVLFPVIAFTTNAASFLAAFAVMQVFGAYGLAQEHAGLHIAYWEHLGGLGFGAAMALIMRLYSSRCTTRPVSPVDVPQEPAELYDRMLDWIVDSARKLAGRPRIVL